MLKNTYAWKSYEEGQTTVPSHIQLFSGPSITMIGYGEMMWMNKSSSGV